MNHLASIAVIGIGATAGTDMWAIVRRQLFGTPPPNYALVGRWLGSFARGQFRHERIAASPAIAGESFAGWAAHYLTGISFAALLVAICGGAWIEHPTLLPALIVGVVTVAAPFLLMQPGMGAGIAASRTPRPAAARLQSLVTHVIFGLGLYAAAMVARLV